MGCGLSQATLTKVVLSCPKCGKPKSTQATACRSYYRLAINVGIKDTGQLKQWANIAIKAVILFFGFRLCSTKCSMAETLYVIDSKGCSMYYGFLPYTPPLPWHNSHPYYTILHFKNTGYTTHTTLSKSLKTKESLILHSILHIYYVILQGIKRRIIVGMEDTSHVGH